MAPQKGSKHALGNDGGRPIERDREKIAKELIEWAQLPDSINLNGFCCTRFPPLAPSKLSQYRDESDMFREAFETAKSYLGERRERMLNEERLHVKAYDMNSSVYDYFLKEERTEEKKKDFEQKIALIREEIKLKQDNGAVPEDLVNNLTSLMGQLAKLQVRNKPEISNKAEAKSV